MDTNIPTFGEQLKKARIRAGFTQPELLEELKKRGFVLSQSGLSHYEKGRRFPDPDLMAAMADVLGVSVDYLTGLTKTQSPVSEIEEALAAASGSGKINKIMDRLSKDKQQQVIAFAEFLLSQEKKTKGTDELNEWIAATEVLMRRYGTIGEDSFITLLSTERPDLAAALGIPTKKKSMQDR